MSEPVPQFVLRVISTDAAEPEDRVPAGPYLDIAIDHAMHLAAQERVRSVMVLDDREMVWAQFNLLWMIPEGWRGDLRYLGRQPS